jgi:hypothetical protein
MSTILEKIIYKSIYKYCVSHELLNSKKSECKRNDPTTKQLPAISSDSGKCNDVLYIINEENTEGAIKNRKSRKTGNIRLPRRIQTNHNTIFVGHHYTQTNTYHTVISCLARQWINIFFPRF